jgi:hypothetical protein
MDFYISYYNQISLIDKKNLIDSIAKITRWVHLIIAAVDSIVVEILLNSAILRFNRILAVLIVLKLLFN